MKTKKVFIFFVFSIISFSLFSQNIESDTSNNNQKDRKSGSQYKKAWAVGIFGGQSIIHGDVNINPKSFGYGIHVQKNISHTMALSAVYAQGNSKGADRKYANNNVVSHNPALNGTNDSLINYETNGKHTYMNYKTNYKLGYLQVVYKFDLQNYRTTKYPRAFFYIFLGTGAFLFEANTDQIDASGNLHDFNSIYQDYIAGIKSQSECKDAVLDLLDGEYETPLEGNPLGTAESFEVEFLNKAAIPVINGGFGIRYKINDRFDLGIETSATYTSNDLLDGQRWTQAEIGLSEYNDVFIFTTIGLNIRLGKPGSVYWFDNAFVEINKVSLENKTKMALLTSDNDSDGVTDYFDKDPITPTGVKVDVSGVPIDTDNDGIADYLDKEPFSDKEAKVDSTGVSIDTDKDVVILTHKDEDIKTPKDSFVDLGEKAISSVERTNIVAGQALLFFPSVYFKFDDANLTTESLKDLVSIAANMKYNPNIKIKAIGYADQQGSSEYNERLSMKRAENSVNFIVGQGISRDRFVIESKGETEPLTSVMNININFLNRRVNFQIIKAVEPKPTDQ